MNGKAEPRFDIDYAFGRRGEIRIEQFLKCIASGNGRVEVKTKRYLDWKFYVETHCDKGKSGHYSASGILATKAEAWAIVFGESGISIMVPTDELRLMIEDPSSADCEETHGNCPTRGKLIDLIVLLYRHKQRIERRQAQIQANKYPRADLFSYPTADEIFK